jgi:hypothetical protein
VFLLAAWVHNDTTIFTLSKGVRAIEGQMPSEVRYERNLARTRREHRWPTVFGIVFSTVATAGIILASQAAAFFIARALGTPSHHALWNGCDIAALLISGLLVAYYFAARSYVYLFAKDEMSAASTVAGADTQQRA